MKEISNKALMYVLFVAIVVSVGSTMYSLGNLANGPAYTGMAISGDVNVTIESTTTINLTDNLIDFGAGGLIGGATSCLLNSSTGTMIPSGCSDFDGDGATSGDTMAFENIGSATLDLGVTGTDATSFIGGDSPTFEGKCASDDDTGEGAAFTIDGSVVETNCCASLIVGGTGTFYALLNVTPNSGEGAKTGTLTFTAG